MSAAARRSGAEGPRGSRRRPALLAGLALVVAACGGPAPTPAGGSASACGAATPVASLPAAVGEASGLARDPRRPDVLWTHNDSGNDLVLYAVDTTGALLERVAVEGGTGRDPEDIALARCGEGWCLWLGDIGDNRGVYPTIHVHRIPLPPLDAPGDAPVVRPDASWTLVYPEGPRDAESLVVDAARGQLGIITKGRTGDVVLYDISLDTLAAAGSSVVTLRRIGPLRVPLGGPGQLVTAADLSPDGRTLAVRSYTELFLFPWNGAARFDTTAVPATASLLSALEPQGEGLAFSDDGTELWMASEGRGGRPPQLSRIRCPAP